MKPIEIVCSSCAVIMRLGDELLERVQGHAGRITCKRCGNKVAIDARGTFLIIRSGGQLLEETTRPGPYFDDATTLPSEAAVTTGPHWSEFPPVSAALTDRAVFTDSAGSLGSAVLSDHAGSHESETSLDGPPSSEVPSVRLSMAPPVPYELKARRAASRAAVEQPAMQMMEAPLPVWRDDGDSLSPHAFGEVEREPASEDYPLRLPDNFKSSPMASSLRDETFKSLYPEPQRIYPSRTGESRFARKIRENAPKPPKLTLPPPAPGQLPSVLQTAPHEQDAHGSNWAPWALAAAAVLGLVINLAWSERVRLQSVPQRAAHRAAAPSMAEQTRQLRGSFDELNFLVFDADANWVEQAPADAVTPQLVTISRANVAAPSGEETAPRGLPHVRSDESERSDLTAAPDPTAASNRNAASGQTAPARAPAAAEQAPPVETIQFSPSSAAEAMQQAAALAGSCRKPGDPSGEARLTVTFAPSGRVTSAQVSGPPFAGTSTGGCIAKQFRSARVPAFSGERVTMTKVVTIQ